MKSKLISVLLVALLGFLFSPATHAAEILTQSDPATWRFQCDLPAAQLQAFLHSNVTDAQGVLVTTVDEIQVTADLTSTAKSVTVGGKTLTYAEVLAAIQAVIAAEKAAKDVAAAQPVAMKPTTVTTKTYLAADGHNIITDYGNGTTTLAYVAPKS